MIRLPYPFLAVALPLIAAVGQEEPSPVGPRAGGTSSSPPGAVSIPTEQWGSDYQIEVFGGTPRARVEFLTYSRELRDRFRWNLFRYRPGENTSRGEWRIPIRIDLWGDVGDVFKRKAARVGIRIGPDSRFEIWAAARLHDRFDEEEFRIEMVRALLVEQMLSPFAASAGEFPIEKFQAPPSWLVQGFDQLLLHKREGRPSAAYSGVVESGAILSPDEIFAESDPESLDPISRMIFRMSSAALVETLLDQPEGDLGLREFLGDLPLARSESVPGLLRQHFPAFREVEDGIRKWWALQVASLGEQQSFEFFSREETERWLTESLTIRFAADENAEGEEGRGILGRIGRGENRPSAEEAWEGTIEEYREFLGRDGFEEKLNESYASLQNLKVAAFPLYRDLIDRYCEVVRKIARRQLVGVSGELEELGRLRETIGATLVRTEDYLNYYEATKSPYRSSEFEEYRRVREALERKGAPPSGDRISRFLDAIEYGGAAPGGAAPGGAAPGGAAPGGAAPADPGSANSRDSE